MNEALNKLTGFAKQASSWTRANVMKGYNVARSAVLNEGARGMEQVVSRGRQEIAAARSVMNRGSLTWQAGAGVAAGAAVGAGYSYASDDRHMVRDSVMGGLLGGAGVVGYQNWAKMRGVAAMNGASPKLLSGYVPAPPRGPTGPYATAPVPRLMLGSGSMTARAGSYLRRGNRSGSFLQTANASMRDRLAGRTLIGAAGSVV